MRSHAKWVFVFLAVVFAGGFVFFGVGSGSTGIGDLLQGNFGSLFGGGGSSGPSISKAQKRIQKNPKDAAAYLQLAHAYEAKHEDIAAISTLESYVRLRPRDTSALGELAGLYQTRANTEAAAVQALASAPTSQLAQSFGPPASSPLGQALADPIQQALSQAGPSPQYREQLALYQQTLRNLESTYRRLAAADPTDGSLLLQYGQSAAQIGDSAAAIAAYRSFLKRFPDDPQAPLVRQQLKKLTGSG